METTSIEERMRELTNQVILPPKAAGRASVNRRSLTQKYLSLWADPLYSHALRLHRQAGPLRSATLRVWSHRPLRPEP
jgi:hypothetical protein